MSIPRTAIAWHRRIFDPACSTFPICRATWGERKSRELRLRLRPVLALDPKTPLRRSRQNALLAGVCSGIAAWLGWDPTLVRVLYVTASVLSVGFPGVLLYLILIFVIPLDK